MNSLQKQNERGALNVLLIPFILITLFFIGAASFGVWAYMGRQDYKNNVDPKIAAAVAVAVQQTASKKDLEFVESEKKPFKSYNGPSAYGSLKLEFPKTWSGLMATSTNQANPVDGYFYPGVVPSISDLSIAFALRIQVTTQSYDQTLQALSSAAQAGRLTTQVYALPKVPDVVGLRVRGQLDNTKTVDMIILPLRDKTLKIWTEGGDFKTDFDNNILPNITFSP